MAHILCMTSGLTGIMNASFELANRLESMGHSITYASPNPISENVKAQGFNFFQLNSVNFDPAPQPPNYQGPLRKIKRLIHKVTHLRARRSQAVISLGMNTFLEQLKDIDPDLTIVDIELHEHIMAMVPAKWKILLLSQWFSTTDSRGLPPIQSDIIPGVGFRGSLLGIKLSWIKVRIQRWFMFFKKKITSAYSDRRSILQKYAGEAGFSKTYIRKNYWPGPFTYEGLPMISMTSEGLEFPHRKSQNQHYVGPMVSVNRREIDSSPDTINTLESIFKKKIEEGKKLIYCSVSTFQKGDHRFLKKVIGAVGENPDWLLVISLGGLLDSSEFNQLPENVFAFNRVPQLKVLKEADLSINHGGIHTINECLHFKVPMLIYSGKKSDQNGCAARVQFHGLGIMADKDVDNQKTIQQNIERVLKEKQYLTKAEELNKAELQNQTLDEVVNRFLEGVNDSASLIFKQSQLYSGSEKVELEKVKEKV